MRFLSPKEDDFIPTKLLPSDNLKFCAPVRQPSKLKLKIAFILIVLGRLFD